MTFDNQVATTVSGALADLRDKVGGMTGWSIAEDTLGSGDDVRIVWDTPWNSEALKFRFQYDDGEGNVEMNITYGRNYDTGDQSWGTTFATSDSFYMATSNPWDPADDGEYWLQYTADYGFVWYFRRTMGDGSDKSGWFGHASWMNEAVFWDYYTAGAATPPVPRGYFGYGGRYSNGEEQYWETADLSHIYGGEGLLNPDNNFSNYVWDKPVWQYNEVQNNDTGENPRAVRGHEVWLQDRSGTAINSGDVIQDDGGTDRFMLVDYHDRPLLMSME